MEGEVARWDCEFFAEELVPEGTVLMEKGVSGGVGCVSVLEEWGN